MEGLKSGGNMKICSKKIQIIALLQQINISFHFFFRNEDLQNSTGTSQGKWYRTFS